MVCHSGIGLVPVVDGEVHQFSAGGLYNGLVLLIDDETRSYWDHITGEAVHGPLHGKRLESFSISVTTVEAALAREPDLRLHLSRPGIVGRLMALFSGRAFRGKGFIPPGFARTMGEKDPRLPKMEQGLGVMPDGQARYYPLELLKEGVEDRLGGRALRVSVDPTDKVPFAEWCDDGTRPKQTFSRWYGFSYAYPECGIFPGGKDD